MKVMHCPLNGPRNISEFVCFGEVKAEPALDCSDNQWADYVFLENNTAGIVHEWWLHNSSSYWFIATRHTVTEEIIKIQTVDAFFARSVSIETVPINDANAVPVDSGSAS